MFKINVWSFCVLVMPYTLKGHKKVLLVLFSNEIACASSFMIVICANFVFILLPVFREDLQNLGIVASFGETRALAPKIFFLDDNLFSGSTIQIYWWGSILSLPSIIACINVCAIGVVRLSLNL